MTMPQAPVIAIFDVGKTNKKLFLFDEQYRIVMERTARFTETTDEDGDPCENLDSLRLSIYDSLREIGNLPGFAIKAINFSSYGASFVYIDETGRPLTPLYNYLKAYPPALHQQFYAAYGGETLLSQQTASPVLGSLNAGMQLYRLKMEQPAIFEQLKFALHLPQYLSYLVTGVPVSDLTSIGCHTALWDFQRQQYHHWTEQEGLTAKLAPILKADQVFPAAFPRNDWQVGIGLHDSSAALIPYLVSFQEPFVLISTGTWCISMNPFNDTPLTATELQQDCLCYLTYKGLPVKASRLFAGHEHEQQVKRIAAYFHTEPARYRAMAYDPRIMQPLKQEMILPVNSAATGKQPTEVSAFEQRDLAGFVSDVEAYHQLMLDIVSQQYHSTQLVLKGSPVKRLFVDGGFSKNALYMHLLASFFPGLEIFAAGMAQATALGAALSIHASWNSQPYPGDLIALKHYVSLP